MDESLFGNIREDILTYPSHLVKEKDKQKKPYCLRYAQATYQRWKSSRDMFIYDRRSDWMENRMYAQGNQAVEKYQRWFVQAKRDESDLVGYADLDWTIISTIPKVRDIVLGYMNQINFKIEVDNISPQADLAREKYKFDMWAEAKLAPHLAMMEELTGVPLRNTDLPFVPESPEELELFMSMSFKLQEEVAFSEAVEAVFYDNKWPEIARKVREDLFDLGFGATMCYIDEESQKIVLEYVDPVNILIQQSREKNFSNNERIGRIVKKTIGQLRREAGDYFTREEYIEMANTVSKKYSNTNKTYTYDQDYVNTDDLYYGYDDTEIHVCEVYWRSIDTQKHLEKKVHDQDYIFPYKEGHKLKNGEKLLSTDLSRVYRCKWILDTEKCYDFGLMPDQSRYDEEYHKPYNPIHVYRVNNKSHLERMIPFANEIQMNRLKLQNCKARATPKGFKVQIGALENISIDGKEMAVNELLKMYTQTGVLVYQGRTIIEDNLNQVTDHKVIEELQGGLGTEFRELAEDTIRQMSQMNDVSGLNDVMAAQQPHPDTAVGVSGMLQQQSLNSLNPLIEGFMELHQETARDIISKLKTLAMDGGLSLRYKRLGASLIKTIEISSEMSEMDVGLKVKRGPTEQTKNWLRQTMAQALGKTLNGQPGGLEVEDTMMVERMMEDGNVDLAEAMLHLRLQKRRKEFDQKQDDRSMLEHENRMTEIQAANTKEGEKANNELQKIQLKEELQKQRETELEEQKHRNRLKELQAAARNPTSE